MKFSPAKLRIRLSLGCLILLSLSGFALAQDKPMRTINYRLAMSRPVSHLFEVTIEVELPKDSKAKPVDFQMAKWSPGRYAVFDFAKNVQEFQALAGICPKSAQCKMAPLPVTRVDDQTWRVNTSFSNINAESLTIRYKVFSNDLSGTFSQLDSRHANYNPHTLFMYVVGHKPDPVRLSIDPPAGWKIANGRMERADQREWEFPNWDIFADTPTEIAPDFTIDEFDVDGKHYRVMVHSFGDEGKKRPALVKDIEKIVRAETAMWGPPEFDSYTFLIHFAADDISGDGMEHLTSTQIIESGALGETGMYDSALGTVAHEFFHVWNVKRLRPAELGPWDFTRPVSTRSLWIAEGFTNYYGHLMLHRAGIWDAPRFLARESQTISGIENAPGSRWMSAENASLSAPFLDDAPHAQQVNLSNTAISYYPKGELVGMVLDLLIRGRSNGRGSLDEVMRRLYSEMYLKSPNSSYYLRGRGYKPEDLERIASEVAGSDLSDFFRRYTRDVEVLPYEEAFRYVGLRVQRSVAREPYNAGITLDVEDDEGLTIGSVQHDSPAENAGLQKHDEITSLDGKKVKRENFLAALSKKREGERIPVTLHRNRQTIRAVMVLGPPERFDYKIEEIKEATPEQKTLRQEWLSGQ
jgi:predicted metalloprotease with PDZ domain